ncbi:MAG: adenylosuccinate lyase [candidate division KSB1 bacterium]|nr:adenylosuccinate lyase [candidate division KSB1 bacterium]
MIQRYTLPQMAAIWSDENKYRTWLEVEILACEAQARLGKIPQEVVPVIRQKAKFEVARILEIEETVKHDVIAFLTNVAEHVGEASRYIHLGMTSSDLLDTSLAVLMRQAGEIILSGLKNLREVLKTRALEHKDTVCIGRSHGVHAEPTTFGLKMALWYDELGRDIRRLERAIEIISVGKISGAVGTFAHLEPEVEEYVCQKLNLKPAAISTQILQRDRHAEFLTTLALIACSLEKFATEIRSLQRTEILEVEEPFTKGQKGSSAMPHKRNPITCERIVGLARLVRANALAAMENVALWHERDITHSSVERVIIPDSTILVHYMLTKFTQVMTNLVVYPENMKKNLEKTRGLIFSQYLLLALVEKGLSREKAYSLVQENAMKVWESNQEFKDAVLKDDRIKKVLTLAEIEACFDLGRYLTHVDRIFQRVGLL